MIRNDFYLFLRNFFELDVIDTDTRLNLVPSRGQTIVLYLESLLERFHIHSLIGIINLIFGRCGAKIIEAELVNTSWVVTRNGGLVPICVLT